MMAGAIGLQAWGLLEAWVLVPLMSIACAIDQVMANS